jgi:hypothetical protein
MYFLFWAPLSEMETVHSLSMRSSISIAARPGTSHVRSRIASVVSEVLLSAAIGLHGTGQRHMQHFSPIHDTTATKHLSCQTFTRAAESFTATVYEISPHPETPRKRSPELLNFADIFIVVSSHFCTFMRHTGCTIWSIIRLRQNNKNRITDMPAKLKQPDASSILRLLKDQRGILSCSDSATKVDTFLRLALKADSMMAIDSSFTTVSTVLL